MDRELQKQLATAARILSADMIENAASGHPGAALGMADIVSVLYTSFLSYDASCPDWANRDRVVFSNGHASALIYSMLYLLGIGPITINDLKQFRKIGSYTPGHPERGLTEGIDFSTGPLGQGFSGAVGLALAERMIHARFPDLMNHKTYCFVGDGCLMEGISEEVLELAGLWKLKNLIVLWDDNQITIDGRTDIATKTNMAERFKASGWQVLSCNGHDYDSIFTALSEAQNASAPVFIDCKTVIGYGASTKCNTSKVHGSPLGTEEIKALRKTLNWLSPAFEIPKELLEKTRSVGLKGKEMRLQWDKSLASSTQKDDFIRSYNGEIEKETLLELNKYKKQVADEKPEIATRKASQNCLSILLKVIPFFIGGSADLGSSNLTKTENSVSVMPDTYQGNYINYGVREQGMAGISNGLAAHGGLIPYSSTFFSFSDYMKPCIRLGALMKLRQLYILTHDSLGAGEDGPTHQPVEQLGTFRSMPNCLVFRPADGVETAECYQIALSLPDMPSLLVLSRQNLPTVCGYSETNRSARGGYVLSESKGVRQITFIATGSEVRLAIEAQAELEKMGIKAGVVSMPCVELFLEQEKTYQEQVLGDKPCVIIEAASPDGWYRFLNDRKGRIIGQDSFGTSGKGTEVLKHFGFTVEHIVQVAKEVLNV